MIRFLLVRAIRAAAALLLVLASATPGAPQARSSTGTFRVEEDAGAPTRGAVVGWVYNEGRETVGLLRLRMDVLDESGQVVAVQRGWAYGNLRPGDRAYFRIPLPGRPGRRVVVVESFVIQSVESP
ncbi:MAG TPA: FxLYD domain-containing protein [Methylomirabilota bacterium]|nr:FxLYD domain-containing protein [Methylomirabilota bacterium]